MTRRRFLITASDREPPRVLLVGQRKAAVDAVRRLGFEPISYTQPRRFDQADRAYGGTIDEARSFAIHTLGVRPPRAVIAVAEGAVPAAAAIRAHFGLPGISSEVAARCHDKAMMKAAMLEAGVPCAAAMVTDASTTPEALIDTLGLPLVFKVPVSSGGRGVRIVRRPEDVRAELRAGLLVESFVEGVEMSVETLSDRGRVLFRNHTRYAVVRWANVVPADLAADTRAAVDALADRALAALGLEHGISHIEMFLTEEGPVFSEIAARPPGGRLMELIACAYGFDPWEVLIRSELGEGPIDLPREAARYCGNWFLHPGEGRVRSVSGLESARAVEGVTRVRCTVQPGDRIETRVGSGQTVGEVRAEADSSAECEARLRRAHDLIRIDLDP